jgi:hypothetical protein
MVHGAKFSSFTLCLRIKQYVTPNISLAKFSLCDYYYYYCILRLSAKRYEELLAIRLGKPFMNKNPRHSSFAHFLCSPLLIYGC